VSIVVGSFYPAVVYGGPIFSILNLGKGLAMLGVDVYVSTTNANGKGRLKVPTGEFIKFGDRLSVKYYGGADEKSFSWAYFIGLWNDIRNADVVYLQSIFSFHVPVTLLYARILGKPVLLSPRGSLGSWCLNFGSRFKRLWLSLIIRPFAGYVSWHATSVQEEMEIRSLYKKARVHVVPNIVELLSFSEARSVSKKDFLKRYAGIDGEFAAIIVSMGRLHAKKGFDILIDAFSVLTKDFPRSALFIAGDDCGEKDKLLRKISDAGLEGNVFLTGHLEGGDKAAFLAGADVFALSSHNENFGNVYAEALACGTPIVASTSSPWQDVEKMGCGKWVDNTADDFAKAIASILNSDMQLMGEKGREYVNNSFGWEKVSLKMNSVFEEMIGVKG
ncbi:MAG: glycosyltransferase, partial [Methylobacter sp.]